MTSYAAAHMHLQVTDAVKPQPTDPTMDPNDVAFVKGVISFMLVAGTGIGTFWLWLRSRAKAPSDFDSILEGLREEHAQIQADLSARMAELEERVDFAERQLVQGRQTARLPEPSEHRTPA